MNENVTINVVWFDFKVVRVMPTRAIQIVCRAQQRIIMRHIIVHAILISFN